MVANSAVLRVTRAAKTDGLRNPKAEGKKLAVELWGVWAGAPASHAVV
jgi:hypothetical protein